MSLLGTLLPGILGVLNPANIIKGVINVGSGILENISKGKPLDITGNLARGLKTAIGEEQSALGSVGGSNQLEPSVAEKMSGAQNAANVTNIPRMNAMAEQLRRATEMNAANHRGVWSEDRTRSMQVGKYPATELTPLERAVESAPAGMPDRRVSYSHTDMRRVPARDLLNSRDQYGYKSTPVVMQGVRGTSVKMPKYTTKKKKKAPKKVVKKRKPVG